jgi:ppGpp synthetase/RelA/SpoT-type nucleotidyltranferase
MTVRTVEDRLREEYFCLLPAVRKTRERLDAKVRHNLIYILDGLRGYERLEIRSRIKDCESSINALKRRQEGSLFDPDYPEKYSLRLLKDLAGVRVLVFPRGLIQRVDASIRKDFESWTADHVHSYKEGDDDQALKYYGLCPQEDTVYGEIQIVPMLTGLFWEVEHEAIYKPKPEYRSAANSLEMQERVQEILDAFKAFEKAFEKEIESQCDD